MVINKKRGKQAFKRTINSLIMNLVILNVTQLLRKTIKVIITLKPIGRRAIDIENSLNNWFKQVPYHLFKSITFDCGKEFSNLKSISNLNDIDIYFAYPGTPSQRGLMKTLMSYYVKIDYLSKWISKKVRNLLPNLSPLKEIIFL